MTQAQWKIAVEKALAHGPVRFDYFMCGIHYKLTKALDDEWDGTVYTYSLEVYLNGRMDNAYTFRSLEEVIERHPLDRFTIERSLGEYL